MIANALHIMPNPDKAISEICRVLKPNGVLFAPTFVRSESRKYKLWVRFMGLVNISDTLALSVETRGFALGKVKYSVYKREVVTIWDLLFLLGIALGATLMVAL